MNRKGLSANMVSRVGVMGAIAAVLYFAPEIPIIGFYKLDFSTLPALLGGFAMGPWAGLLIVLIKDVVGLTHSTTAFVGELADFLCSGAFVAIAALWYRRARSFRGAVVGMSLGILVMSLIGALTNYYVLIPFYIGQMGMSEQAIVGMIAKAIPAVDSLFEVVLYATVPFNLFKGVVLGALTLMLYKRLSPWLHAR